MNPKYIKANLIHTLTNCIHHRCCYWILLMPRIESNMPFWQFGEIRSPSYQDKIAWRSIDWFPRPKLTSSKDSLIVASMLVVNRTGFGQPLPTMHHCMTLFLSR